MKTIKPTSLIIVFTLATFAIAARAGETPEQPPANSGNTWYGYQALFNNNGGFFNNAFGYQALYNNITGTRNVADGGSALLSLTSGDRNVAIGASTLSNAGAVNYNTGVGARALYRSNGNQNTALGFFAGSNLRDGGTNNIYIENVGPDPSGTESNTIRLGTQTATTATVGSVSTFPMPAHTDTYIAGIFGSSTITPGMPVYVDSNGKLGTLPSSERFKQDVKPMNAASDEIYSLQPVTFRYKPEVTKSNAAQFGLVAEEVAKVDPNLVVRDDKGQIQSVRYEAVNAMMLNELIKEHQQVQNQQKQIEKLASQLKEQASMLQKVGAQVELMKTAPRTVADSH
jgi:trimeric autotransporter adhesin